MADKKNPLFEKFLAEHLPKVPDFVKANAPKFDPGYRLGPVDRPQQTHEQSFVDAYLNGDVRHLTADMHGRPEHYTAEQKEIVEALQQKKPLPPGTRTSDINEIVLRMMERSDHREKREKIIQQAQKASEPKSDPDPTVDRLLKVEAERDRTFENQESMPKAIKII